MGGLPKEGAPAVDVSVEGTLVWLRRPNGSWWPSIVISPQDVPEGCPPPPRCPATPIMLLGRRPDGPTYVDWCNLDRCKRVKPFRCGELDFEQRITNALTLAATGNRSTWSYNKGRYARMEDAILQALDIEKERALGPATKAYLHAGSCCSPRPKIEMPNGQVKDAAAKDASPAIQPSPPLPLLPPPPPPPKRKRKTPYDSEDDAPKGSRRMRDLRDIGSKTVPPMDLPDSAAISAPKYDDLPNDGQVKRIVHSQATTKRKHAAAHQDQPCGIPRKKDRSRPLAELCNGDMWNGSRPNGQKADEHLLDVATCSSISSGTSTLDTPLDMNSCHRSAAFKTDRAKGTEISCMTRLLSDDSRHGNDFVETPPAAQNIVEPDHLHRYQPCGLTKNPTWKPHKQANDVRKAEKRARKNIKMRTISSVDQEGKNRTRDSNDRDHHKTKTGKHKAARDEVVLLEKRLNKPAEHDAKMHIAVVPCGMDCVGGVQQRRCKSKCDPEESLETLSNHSNCESGSISSLVFEKPLQVLPPEKKPLGHERCHAVKPIKTLHLNPTLYDVELSVLGSSNSGRRVPLVSLMSRWNRKPVVGYPVSVEVSDDVFDRPLSRKDVQRPATSSVNGIVLKKDETEGLQRVVPSSTQTSRPKPKSHSRRPSEKEVDKLWQPHTKKPASSSRKMRRLSSFASGQRDGDDRKSAVGKVAGGTIACIPLRVVFSRINEALSFSVNENALSGCGAASRLRRR
ncbi:unnamed protein product [Miscanthus lutarioriparius]|uniref:PWWP domain-containing protein n=1 Tax=Miscanthus lutarioriparius TaxID=422564 RepID=A0A811RS16_9POAL|nr:unnamed protein product [Miscanthus lutarioriparius]